MWETGVRSTFFCGLWRPLGQRFVDCETVLLAGGIPCYVGGDGKCGPRGDYRNAGKALDMQFVLGLFFCHSSLEDGSNDPTHSFGGGVWTRAPLPQPKY